MNTRHLLDRLLRAGDDLLRRQGGSRGPAAGRGLDDLLKGSRGELAGSAVALLLGNRKLRKLGGKALKSGGLLKLGSVAAIGLLAFKAYQSWQSKQASAPQDTPRTIDRLPAKEAEGHGRAILAAMLGAAKADGHIDDSERALIDQHLDSITDDHELTAWVDAQLEKPVDPVEIAALAPSREAAAEMYLASLMMIDEENFMEKAYLDELANRLQLDESLRAELRATVASLDY